MNLARWLVRSIVGIRVSDERILKSLQRIELKMADLLTEVMELEADDVAVIAALNALAQTIKDLQANQADPALVARLEKVHQDFVTALNPTPPSNG